MSVLLLADAKKHLNINGFNHDDELQAMIDAAEAAIAERVGPLAATSVTERVAVTGGALLLKRYPVISLTSVTPRGGSAISVDNLAVSTEGLVEYADGHALESGVYTVAYSAGRATCPADLLVAVKELVRHMWQTQRGPTGRPGSTAGDTVANTIPGAAYVFPFRVEQLLAPHLQPVIG